MATDTALPPPAVSPARRHYWQLPTFALGLAAAVAAYLYFPPPPTDPGKLFARQLGDLKQALDHKPVDLAAVERLAPQVAADADRFPASAPQARYLAGSGYLALAESNPSDPAGWDAAAALLTRVEPSQLPDPQDQKRLAFRRAMAETARGTGDPAALLAQLIAPPPGEETDGERYRLLAEAALRTTPPDHKRARDALTAYLTGPGRLPPAVLASYRLKLAETHLALNEPKDAAKWLKEVGPSAPAEAQAAARAQLARLAAAENNWPEAVKLYESALAAPGLPDEQRGVLRYQAAVALVQTRNVAAAVPHFEQAAKESGPVAAAASVRLAELTLRDPAARGQRIKAVETLEAAVRDAQPGSEFRNPYLSADEVRAAFEEAVQVCLAETDYPSAVRAANAYSKVAAAGRDREKRAEANAAWAAALAKTPATAAGAPDKFKAAAKDYLALGTDYPTPAGKADLLRRAADCFRQAGDAPSAAAIFSQITTTPGLPEDAVAAAWLEKGNLLLTAGRTSDAVEALKKAMAAPGPAAKARVKLAVAHLDLARQGGPGADKQVQYAENLFMQAADSTADAAADREAQEQALFELGKLRLTRGNLPDAEARFRQQLQTHPTGKYAGPGKLYLGSCLLLLARGDQTGRPPADADRKLAEAAKLFQELSDSSDEFLKTQADVRLANTTLLLKKYDEMPPLCEKLASRYRGKVEELIVLSMLYSSYRFADRSATAAKTLARMEEVFARLPADAFRGGAEEYTREYWVKQWFEPLRKKP